jgi:hypothetical protein
MRRFAVALLAALTFSAFAASPASAEVVTEPNAIQVSLTESHKGTKLTASYAACGSTVPWSDEYGNLVTAYDPYAQYIATVKKGKRGGATIWAHDIGDLNATLVSYYGYGLTQDQVDMFRTAEATYTCTLG